MSDIVDKKGWLTRSARDLVFELGCGPVKTHPDAIGVDMLDTDAVDVIGEAKAVLDRFPAGCARHVTSSHFLEHVSDLDGLLHSIARVLADGGTMEARVPHFSNPYFYSDPTHHRFFGLYTFSYLADDRLLRRTVPRYGKDFGFTLEEIELVFDSPFPGRRLVKRAIGGMVNLSTYTLELYEETLASIVPCYEIRVLLRRNPRVVAGGAP